jgi:hypothetical protein
MWLSVFRPQVTRAWMRKYPRRWPSRCAASVPPASLIWETRNDEAPQMAGH